MAESGKKASSRPSGNGDGARGQVQPERDKAGEAPRQEIESVTALVRRLIDDVSTLFRAELSMATAEVLESVESMKSGLASMLGGAAVLYAGLLFLMLAAVFGLAERVEPWLAALIVGAVGVAIGFVMLQSSKRKLRATSLTPQRTMKSVRKDAEVIGRQNS